jgi:hypothetical protein
MSALRRHPLVRADISDAVNWNEDQQPGLGLEFAQDFLQHYRFLARDAQLYAVRFDDVRRLNLDRFPYGLFTVFSTSSERRKSGFSPFSMPVVTRQPCSLNGGLVSKAKAV